MPNKLIIDGTEYDLNRLIKCREVFALEAERHLIVDPRIGGRLHIRAYPEILPTDAAYMCDPVFYEYDRQLYPLIGRGRVYEFLDSDSLQTLSGYKITKHVLKKFRFSNGNFPEAADPLVENQNRMRSDERPRPGMDRTRQSQGFRYHDHPSTRSEHSGRAAEARVSQGTTGTYKRPNSGRY